MWQFNWGIFWAVLAALAVRGLAALLGQMLGFASYRDYHMAGTMKAFYEKLDEIKAALSK